jgi:hypothetical protein
MPNSSAIRALLGNAHTSIGSAMFIWTGENEQYTPSKMQTIRLNKVRPRAINGEDLKGLLCGFVKGRSNYAMKPATNFVLPPGR